MLDNGAITSTEHPLFLAQMKCTELYMFYSNVY